MRHSLFKLKLSGNLMAAVRRRAAEDGVALDDWICAAIEHRISESNMASAFFRRRAQGGSPEEFFRLLRQSPDVPPNPGDEID